MHPSHDATPRGKSRNKEQRKAGGGFNYDILDELLGLERTKRTGNPAAAFALTTHDGQWIRQAEISA
jgi:hypothetical protein